ncbi:MAG: alpha/beta hydrolase [Bacteroidota bacterium]
MKKMLSLITVFALVFVSCGGGKKEEPKKEKEVVHDTVVVTEAPPKDSFMVYGFLEFPSKDGLLISANSYEITNSHQYILLCHQAGYSRGEYKETAKKFNELGYNCLAIDARSGDECNDMVNETAKRAKAAKKGTTYLDAEQDIIAAIEYISGKTGQKVVLCGSSYSASLALKIGKENENVEAVLAFSPGEYMRDVNLAETIKGFNKPVFITSAKSEVKDYEGIAAAIESTIKDIFVPAEEGIHGSSALWEETKNHTEYWAAVEKFLEKLKAQS